MLEIFRQVTELELDMLSLTTLFYVESDLLECHEHISLVESEISYSHMLFRLLLILSIPISIIYTFLSDSLESEVRTEFHISHMLLYCPKFAVGCL
jgi:hypothetical protein